jgi:hypothetical protein
VNWKPGDLAIVRFTDVQTLKRIGFLQNEIVELIEYRGLQRNNKFRVSNAWKVIWQDKIFYIEESCLFKPYDGHEKSTWDKVKVWKPKELVSVEN